MSRSRTFDAVIRLRDQASQQLSKLETKLANHEKAWKRTGKSIQRTFSKVQSAGQTMTATVTAPLAAVGVAGFNFATDLEDSIGASEQIFGSHSATVQKWAKELPAYYGIAEKDAMQYATTMGAMMQNIGGMTEEEASKQVGKLIEMAGDASAMFGGKPEEAMYAFQAALKGNYTMLDNYGMGVNIATIKTKALEMGLASANGELTLADKQTAALALMEEQMADSMGQASREAEGASGTVKEFKTELVNLATEIGTTLLPIITPMLQNFSKVVQRFGNLSEGAKRTIVIVGMLVASIGPLLMIIGTIGMQVGGLLVLFASMGPIVGALGGVLSSAFLPVIAILGVLIGTTILVAKNWDKIKAKAIEIGTAISEAWSNMVQRWKDGFNQAKENIAEAMENLKERLATALEGIKENILNFLLGPLRKVRDLIDIIGNSKVGQKVMSGVSNLTGIKIGSNYSGTPSWRGGLTAVHERGGEIIDLQAGARIWPHDKSVAMAYREGATSNAKGSQHVTVDFNGAVFHVREEADINLIGNELARRIKLASLNTSGVTT